MEPDPDNPKGTAAKVMDAIPFDAAAERREMQKLLTPVFLEAMATGAAVEVSLKLLLLGPSKQKAERPDGEKATTAQQAAEQYGIEIPPNISLDLPDWFLAQAFKRLAETYKKPYWLKVPETTRNDIAVKVAMGVANGESIRNIAKQIADANSAYSKIRSLNVARTETGNAMNSGHELGIRKLGEESGLEMGKEWLSVLGPTTRDTHADADGQQVAVDEVFSIGGHSARWPGDEDLPAEERCNCFVGTVEIEGSVVACSRMWYEGPVTEIVSTGGRRLSVTPNHPILTANGFVRAGKLQIGDKLLAARGWVHGSPRAAADDQQNKPAGIAELFDALATAGFDATISSVRPIEKRRAHSQDFYGDGSLGQGEIDVKAVPAVDNLVLGGRRVSLRQHKISDHALELPNRAGGSVPSLATSMSGSHDGWAVTYGDPLPAGCLPIGVGANLDARFLEPAMQDRASEAELFAQTLERNAGLVELDDVSEIRNRDFSGHVFDPECVNGLVIADGILSKQCQCTVISSIIGEALEDDEEAPEQQAEPEPEPIFEAGEIDENDLQANIDDDQLPPPEVIVTEAEEPEATVPEADLYPPVQPEKPPEPEKPKPPPQVAPDVSDGIPDVSKLTDTGKSLGGSTGAKLMKDEWGNLFVVKKGSSPEHVREEYRAEQAYRALGVRVPGSVLQETDKGPVKVSRFIPDSKPLSSLEGKERDAAIAQVRKSFAADAVLGNWDVAGLNLDNVMVDKEGKVYRIDTGGALRFRAQGSPKGDKFTDTPLELWTLRDASKNPASAKVFGGLTNKEMEASATAVLKKKKELLAAVKGDKELEKKLKSRLDALEVFRDTSKTFRKDGFKDGYVDQLTRHQMQLEDKKVFAKLPKKMTNSKGSNAVIFADENGKLWDHLREKDGPRGKFLEYCEATGVPTQAMTQWAGAQAGSSQSSSSLAHKHWVEQQKPPGKGSPGYWKIKNQKKYYDSMAKQYGGEEKLNEAFAANHAYNYEMLRRMNFEGNDTKNGVVYLARTEGSDVKEANKFQLGEAKKYPVGACESYSLAKVVSVHGAELTYVEVPHTRVFGNYFSARDPRLPYGDSMFMGDGENEFVVNAEGLEVKYMGQARAGTKVTAEAELKKPAKPKK